MIELRENSKQAHGIDNSGLGEGNFGYDPSGDINLGGGM